jgi:V/A-type H+-transporting ATPase subunit K
MLEATSQLATVVLQNNATSFPAIPANAAAALAVGLAALGAGYAERGIGAAAVGAVAEDDDMFVRGLIFTVLPETLVILALVTLFLTTGIPWGDVPADANFVDLLFGN